MKGRAILYVKKGHLQQAEATTCNKLNAAFINRVVIMINKEVFDTVRANKSTFFIERTGHWTISCANLQYRILLSIFFRNKINERLTVTLTLIVWIRCNVFNFKNAFPFVGYNTFAFNPMIVLYIHRSSINVSVYHVFLFVSQQQ